MSLNIILVMKSLSVTDKLFAVSQSLPDISNITQYLLSLLYPFFTRHNAQRVRKCGKFHRRRASPLFVTVVVMNSHLTPATDVIFSQHYAAPQLAFLLCLRLHCNCRSRLGIINGQLTQDAHIYTARTQNGRSPPKQIKQLCSYAFAGHQPSKAFCSLAVRVSVCHHILKSL